MVFLGLPLLDTFCYVTTVFFQISTKRILNNIMPYNYFMCWVLTFGLLFVVRLHTVLNNVTATFRFRLSLSRIFMTSELSWIMEIVGMCELPKEVTL